MPEKIHVAERWTTPTERCEVADKHSRRFKAEIEAAKMVQEDPFVKSFRFVTGQDLVQLSHLPRFQDIRHKLVPFDRSRKMFFISHRWLAREETRP
jgi:hypothetical protein